MPKSVSEDFDAPPLRTDSEHLREHLLRDCFSSATRECHSSDGSDTEGESPDVNERWVLPMEPKTADNDIIMEDKTAPSFLSLLSILSIIAQEINHGLSVQNSGSLECMFVNGLDVVLPVVRRDLTLGDVIEHVSNHLRITEIANLQFRHELRAVPLEAGKHEPYMDVTLSTTLEEILQLMTLRLMDREYLQEAAGRSVFNYSPSRWRGAPDPVIPKYSEGLMHALQLLVELIGEPPEGQLCDLWGQEGFQMLPICGPWRDGDQHVPKSTWPRRMATGLVSDSTLDRMQELCDLCQKLEVARRQLTPESMLRFLADDKYIPILRHPKSDFTEHQDDELLRRLQEKERVDPAYPAWVDLGIRLETRCEKSSCSNILCPSDRPLSGPWQGPKRGPVFVNGKYNGPGRICDTCVQKQSCPVKGWGSDEYKGSGW